MKNIALLEMIDYRYKSRLNGKDDASDYILKKFLKCFVNPKLDLVYKHRFSKY